MFANRNIEIFSLGCPVCVETIQLVNRLAHPSAKVTVLDMKDPVVFQRAQALGILSIPAVAVDGKLVECCKEDGPNESNLRAAGVGEGAITLLSQPQHPGDTLPEPTQRSEEFSEGFRLTRTSTGLRIDCLCEPGRVLILDREKLASFGLRFQHDQNLDKNPSER